MYVCTHVCVYAVGMHVCANARVCVCVCVYVVGMHVCYAWHA